MYYEMDAIYQTADLDKTYNDLYGGKDTPAMDSMRFREWYVQPFRRAILVTSALAVFCFLMREKYRRTWIKSVLPSINEN